MIKARGLLDNSPQLFAIVKAHNKNNLDLINTLNIHHNKLKSTIFHCLFSQPFLTMEGHMTTIRKYVKNYHKCQVNK